jgi:hypothetical protein
MWGLICAGLPLACSDGDDDFVYPPGPYPGPTSCRGPYGCDGYGAEYGQPPATDRWHEPTANDDLGATSAVLARCTGGASQLSVHPEQTLLATSHLAVECPQGHERRPASMWRSSGPFRIIEIANGLRLVRQLSKDRYAFEVVGSFEPGEAGSFILENTGPLVRGFSDADVRWSRQMQRFDLSGPCMRLQLSGWLWADDPVTHISARRYPLPRRRKCRADLLVLLAPEKMPSPRMQDHRQADAGISETSAPDEPDPYPPAPGDAGPYPPTPGDAGPYPPARSDAEAYGPCER